MTMPTVTRCLQWLDDHILILLVGFLIAFIPLYPKLPLFEAIPGYIVRVRLEDLLILGTAIVWLVQVLRRKVEWRSPLFWLIVAYAIVGFLSVLSAIFITKTVPFEALHIGKTALHYVRYLEYFSLFVMAFSAIKTKQQVKVLLAVIVVCVLAITIYGYGQKEYYWPVYSTMNREFSKGIRLYLTEHARVQSTFGGHYDLSAYLVVVLPIILAMAFIARRRSFKIILHVIHILGVWLMIVSAARSSFIAYLVALVIVIGLFAWQKRTWAQKIWWGSSRFMAMSLVIGVMMLYFGGDIYARFLQVLQGYPTFNTAYHSINHQRKQLMGSPVAYLSERLGLSKNKQPPPNSMSTAEAEQQVLVPSDQRPVPDRPSDVYTEVPDIVEVATISASGAATTILVDNGPRTYSDCALEKGLSLCIRLDTLWPRAIAGFWRNPLLGSGYATLTKETVGQFTEAESTDNNFLRTLGETGLLGFVTFYGMVTISLFYAFKLICTKDRLGQALAIGFVAGSIGLLINAVYIDVFAASKVAFTYWACAGILIGYAWIVFGYRKEGESQVPMLMTNTPHPKSKPISRRKSTKRRTRHD